ncbi:ABC transporter ATP-binding protein [Sediminivirga luteola]|uniref:ABC transporter ATP-binding protein n=1 Tax=Sediminivirga luteola TaxID=1774748 RepID=UPI001F569B0F|nr:ABC transporter ATP-binding protein [Sediminivirga luteola]MCI2267123.1 ABC transporter ATP-binding protein [Sediminivirga luteola]
MEAGIPAPAQAAGTQAGSDSEDALLVLDGVSVEYGSTRVLHGVDLAVERGELIALLGPSGSGKTTIIRAISGFVHPTAGSITLDGQELTATPIHKRRIGMVFQSYALFPHMSVRDNIAYALKVRRRPASEIRARVDELIDLVRLGGHADKRPAKLSGGQQQRVALARALAMDPELLLLDEPLSNLDANLRRDVGEEIRRLQQRTGTTAIMVTHDRQEAFGMADRIAVLQDGRIQQLDTPTGIYRRPCSAFMAGFVGEANLLPISGDLPDSGPADVPTPIGVLRSSASRAHAAHVLLRPEDIRLHDAGEGLPARIRSTFYYGATLQVELEIGETVLHATTGGTRATRLAAGDVVGVSVHPDDVLLVPASTGDAA